MDKRPKHQKFIQTELSDFTGDLVLRSDGGPAISVGRDPVQQSLFAKTPQQTNLEEMKGPRRRSDTN